MGGRGSSYTRAVVPPQPLTPPMLLQQDDDDQQDNQPQQPLNGTLQKGPANTPSGYTLDDFTKMSDQQMTDLVDWADSQMDLPSNLHDDVTQRMIHALGIDQPMQDIGGRALQKLVDSGATVLYRGIDGSSHSGTHMTADAIADSIRSDTTFSTGGWNGQWHGGGMYMTDDYSGTRFYGTQHVIGAALNSKARNIDGDALIRQADSWFKSHPKMRDSLARIAGVSPSSGTRQILTKSKGYNDEYYTRSVAALAMGYTSISDRVSGNENYFVILDRSTLSTSRYNHRKAMKVNST